MKILRIIGGILGVAGILFGFYQFPPDSELVLLDGYSWGSDLLLFYRGRLLRGRGAALVTRCSQSELLERVEKRGNDLAGLFAADYRHNFRCGSHAAPLQNPFLKKPGVVALHTR